MSDEIIATGGRTSQQANELREILGILQELKGTANDLKNNKIELNMKVPEAKSFKRFVDDIKQGAAEISNIELFNSTAVKKEIDKFTNNLSSAYDKVIKQGKDLTENQTRTFIDSFVTLQKYGETFGKDLTSQYKELFNLLRSEGHNLFDPSDIEKLIAQAQRSLDDKTLKAKIEFDFKEQYINEKAKQSKELYDEERRRIIENSNLQRKEIEITKAKQKEQIESYKSDIKDWLNGQLSKLSSDDAFVVDDAWWGRFQQLMQQVLQLMSSVEIETKDVNDLFAEMTNRIYVNADKLKQFKKNSISGEELNKKDILELLQLYSQLNTESQSASGSLEKVGQAILNIAQSEKELNPNQLEQIKNILSNLNTSSSTDDIVNSLLSLRQVMSNGLAGNTEGLQNDLNAFIELRNQVEQYKSQIDSLKDSLEWYRNSRGSSITWGEYDEKVEEIGNLKSQILQLEDAVSRSNEDISRYQQRIQDVYSQSIDISDYEYLNELYTNSKAQIINLQDELKRVKEQTQAINSEKPIFSDGNNLNSVDNVLSDIEGHLHKIADTIGQINTDGSFNNIVQSLEILLSKLDELQSKVGNGVYNLSMGNQGNYGSPADLIISRERESMMASYRKIVSSFGNERKMFEEMANILESQSDELQGVYGTETLNRVYDPKAQVNLLRAFFEKFENYKQSLQKDIEFITKDIEESQRAIEENSVVVSNKVRFRNSKDNSFQLRHEKNMGMERNIKSEKDYMLQELETRSKYNAERQQQLEQLSQIKVDFLDEEKLNQEIRDTTQEFQDAMNKIQEKSHEILNHVVEELNKIELLLQDISNKDYLGEMATNVIAKFDELLQQIKSISELSSNIKIKASASKEKSIETKKDPIINTLTGKEISQQAYQILDKLKAGADVTVDELRNIPEVKEGFGKLALATEELRVQYQNMNLKDTAEIMNEERKALREYILNLRKASGSFSGIDENGKEVYNGEVAKQRKAVLAFGLPASGKSSSLVNPISQYLKALVPDSDIIKELTPEFNNGWGASLVHRESSNINMKLIADMAQEGANMVIPIVGSTVKSVMKYIDLLKEEGYDVQIALNELSNNESSFRNLMRFFGDGRFLEPGFVREYGNKPSEVFEAIKARSEINGYLKYNNDVGRNERPIFVDGRGYDADLRRYLSQDGAGRNRISESSNLESEKSQIKEINELLEKRRELYKIKDSSDGEILDETIQKIKELDNLLSQKGIDFSKTSSSNISTVKSLETQSKPSTRESEEATRNWITELEKENAAISKNNQTTAQSSKYTEEEAKAMGDLFDKAIKAAEAKKEFSGANKEVLESILKSLSALNAEGNGFANLNKIINNLANNKNDRITIMIQNLESLRDALSSPIQNDSLINAIKEIAQQGENLKYLAEVLKASKQQIKEAKANTVSEEINNQNVLDNMYQESEKKREQALIKEANIRRALEKQQAREEEKRQKEIETTSQKILKERANLLKEIGELSNKGQIKSAYGNELGEFNTFVKGITTDTHNALASMEKIRNRLAEIKGEASSAGKAGKSLIQILSSKWKSLFAYLGSYASFYRIIGYVRQSFETIKELDTQLVDLKKTTSMSNGELEKFYHNSSDVAKQLGVTTSEIIQQAAAWSRLNKIGLLYGNI